MYNSKTFCNTLKPENGLSPHPSHQNDCPLGDDTLLLSFCSPWSDCSCVTVTEGGPVLSPAKKENENTLVKEKYQKSSFAINLRDDKPSPSLYDNRNEGKSKIDVLKLLQSMISQKKRACQPSVSAWQMLNTHTQTCVHSLTRINVKTSADFTGMIRILVLKSKVCFKKTSRFQNLGKC